MAAPHLAPVRVVDQDQEVDPVVEVDQVLAAAQHQVAAVDLEVEAVQVQVLDPLPVLVVVRGQVPVAVPLRGQAVVQVVEAVQVQVAAQVLLSHL